MVTGGFPLAEMPLRQRSVLVSLLQGLFLHGRLFPNLHLRGVRIFSIRLLLVSLCAGIAGTGLLRLHHLAFH